MALVSTIVERFMKGLQAAEKSGDAQELMPLFSADAKLMNLTRHHAQDHGPIADGAARFWHQYLCAFKQVSTTFTTTQSFPGFAVLEWKSAGLLPMGVPVNYAGVTLLQYDDEHISALRTYYDSAAFLPHAATFAKTHSEAVGRPELNLEATS